VISEPKTLDDRYGNSDMVRKWFKLGFIAAEYYEGPRSRGGLPVVYIEKERNPDFPHSSKNYITNN
jgi:hypothetical protein